MSSRPALPTYEPPLARDPGGWSVSGQRPYGFCSNGSAPGDCRTGFIVLASECTTGHAVEASSCPGGSYFSTGVCTYGFAPYGPCSTGTTAA